MREHAVHAALLAAHGEAVDEVRGGQRDVAAPVERESTSLGFRVYILGFMFRV